MKQTEAFFYLYKFILKYEFITLRKSVTENSEAVLINTNNLKQVKEDCSLIFVPHSGYFCIKKLNLQSKDIF